MSKTSLSDLQLDRLLGRVPPPPPPAADLADRIVARSLRTPQSRTSFFRIPRRRATRRRPMMWSVVIAANLMAAAAAATAWDGQQFDFHRLADLPHRVVAAIHVGHRRREAHEQLASMDRSSEPHAVPVPGPPAARLPVVKAMPLPATKNVVALGPSHSPLVVGIERPHAVHAHVAPERPALSVRPLLSGSAKAQRRAVRAAPPVAPVEQAVGAAQQSARESRADQMRTTDRSRLGSSVLPVQRAGNETSSPDARKADRDVQPLAGVDGPDYLGKADRGARRRRWQSPFFKHQHPRERGIRFRGRF